jgi:hypothetical protein
MFELTHNTVDSEEPVIRNGNSYLVFDRKLHGSVGTMKTPIHTSDHEYLGTLTGTG